MTTLFIEADEPLLVFSSVEMAEEYLEAVDARAGVYKRAFGPTGELFSIETEGESVVIRTLKQPADPEGLCKLLQRSLHEVGEVLSPEADLPTLVATTVEFWTKRQRSVTAMDRLGCMAMIVVLAGLALFIWV